MRTYWRRWRWLAGGVLIFGAVFCLMIAFAPSEPLLLKRSTRLLSTRGWRSANLPRPEERAYIWLSPQELLYFVGDGTWKKAYRLNIQTGRQQQVITKRGVFMLPDRSGLNALSPDGQWLMWSGLSSKPPWRVVINASRVDGSRTVTWPQAVGDTPVWMLDSRRWLDMPLFGHNGAMPPTGPPTGSIYSLDNRSPQLAALPGLKNPIWLLGFTSNDRALGLVEGPAFDAGSTSSCKLIEFGIGPQAAPCREWKVPLPPGLVNGTAFLSPHGDRLAWLFYCHRSQLPWLPQASPGVRSSETLWVSRADGSDMHEVGYISVRDDQARTQPLYWRWLPDDKHLSFAYKDALYTVPAD